MASSIVEDIAAFEEQHRYGCLTDLEFAAAVAGVLPVRADDAAGQGLSLVSSPYHNRADAYWEIGQPDRALEDFGEAVRLAPADPMLAKIRGRLLHKLGNLAAALESFDLAVCIAPEDPYHRRARAHCRAEAGELAGAVEDFSQPIAVEPEFAQQYLDRAAVYERLGQASLAEQDRATASRLRG